MPNRYVLHAMGIKKGLLHQKRHLAHYFNSHSPIKHLQIGAGARRKSYDSDSDSEQVAEVAKKQPNSRKLKPISFKF